MGHFSDDFVVYSYSDKVGVFYIGKGKPDRPHAHLCPGLRYRISTHFYHRLNKMLDIEHVFPEIKIIAAGLSEQAAFDMEIALIKQYGRLDIGTGCLTNHTDGGEGCVGGHSRLGQELSIDHRIKLSRPKSAIGRANMKASAAHLATPIESYNLATGQTVKRYPSQVAVKADGYTQAGVSDVLTGRTKKHHWLGWRYSDV
jgi:hypothetical protein